MRLLAIYAFLFLFSCVQAQGLKVTTFNCEFLNKKKIHLKYDYPFNLKKDADKKLWTEAHRTTKLEEASVAVAKHLKGIAADVLGLTEVGNLEDLKVLQATLKKEGVDYPYLAVCTTKDRVTGQHVAILSKYKLLDVQQSFDEQGLYFEESDYDNTATASISKGLKAKIEVAGKAIQLFLFHLKSERGGEESDQKRICQAEIARRIILPYLQKGEHLIVMGDLNSERRHEVLLKLRGFRDVYQELIQTGDDYFFQDQSTRWTYNYRGNMEQIDHILISMSLKNSCGANNYKTQKYGIKTSILPTNNKLVSDHNALSVEFEFK